MNADEGEVYPPNLRYLLNEELKQRDTRTGFIGGLKRFMMGVFSGNVKDSDGAQLVDVPVPVVKPCDHTIGFRDDDGDERLLKQSKDSNFIVYFDERFSFCPDCGVRLI